MNIILNYKATDYQVLDDIELSFQECSISSLLHKYKSIILKSFLMKCQDSLSNKPNHGIYVGRGIERDKEKIRLLLNDHRLNGVVGSLSGSISYDDLVDEVDDVLKGYVFDVYLVIKSRFDSGDSSYFVANLFLESKNYIYTNNYSVYQSKSNIFDFLLVDLLYNELIQASMKGHYKVYERFECNDARVRGSIDVSRHLKLNSSLNNGKVSYFYRERSINNSLNELLILTYNYLKNRHPELIKRKIDSNNTITNYLSIIRQYIPVLHNINDIIKNNLRPISHPYYYEFENIRRLCLSILRDEGVSIFDACSGSVSGFLFYIPDLWENYIENIFNRAILSNIKVVTQDERTISEPLLNIKDKTIRPDFVFYSNDQAFLILDAKMKASWSEYIALDKVNNIIEKDIVKCIRDHLFFNTTGTGVIIPLKDQVLEYRQLDILNMKFYILPFMIPDTCNKSFEEWKVELDHNEHEFINTLKNRIIIPSYKEYLTRKYVLEHIDSLIDIDEVI